jgi:hypothetical protein
MNPSRSASAQTDRAQLRDRRSPTPNPFPLLIHMANLSIQEVELFGPGARPPSYSAKG